MAKYVTVGFDREGDADRFMQLVKGNGNLVQLYQRPVGDNSAKVTNIQARGLHIWTPRPGEARRFEVAGVVVEFKTQEAAHDFLTAISAIASLKKELDYSPEARSIVDNLMSMIEPRCIAGIKLEAE